MASSAGLRGAGVGAGREGGPARGGGAGPGGGGAAVRGAGAGGGGVGAVAEGPVVGLEVPRRYEHKAVARASPVCGSYGWRYGHRLSKTLVSHGCRQWLDATSHKS